jgi:hypothetical protein
MTDVISIIRVAQHWIVVPHRETNSRLWFYAPGFEVYVRGEGASQEFDVLANLAMNEALARHIPAVSLKTCYPQHKEKTASKGGDEKPVQQPLFPSTSISSPED